MPLFYPTPVYILAEACPNVTLTDSNSTGIGTTLTQIGFCTIPGGALGIRSKLFVNAAYEFNANTSNGKTLTWRVGPASGSFATAANFGGQAGLTNQKWTNPSALIWNDGSLVVQRATPVLGGSAFANSTNPSSTFSIDTSLDWNIYFGLQFAVANGGDNATLREFYVHLMG